MEPANVTRRGALSDTSQDKYRNALIDSDQNCWTFEDVSIALDSPPKVGLSGRIGVLIENRLISGLASCAIMRHATCVPLDPKMTDTELRNRINLLGIQSLVVDSDRWTDLDIPSLVTVKSKDQRLTWHGQFTAGTSSTAALILMTSGSTGVPKIVNLSHENLIHSVDAIIESIALTPSDRAINLLPMAHIGGLVDLFLVPLVSGGSVVFTNPRNPADVRSHISKEQITWLQAAPAILQSLLRTRDPHPTKLRLIRSVSAPLPQNLYQQIATAFDVPIIEMYGMSETAGVITSNPLPPSTQKIGSVGKAVNCEVLIKNSNEVWVRSNGLFSGYPVKNDNDGLWEEGAFFTGDLGHLDDDGYLFLTGRAKDIINRGGQKISPREIDQVVESWPEINEAASFAIPHPTLGEEVGLAFVPAQGENLSDQEIRQRLSSKLADYKLPKRLIRLEELPRNQGGKLQRFLLSEITPTHTPSHSKQSTTENKITPLWCSVLGIQETTSDLDFFDQGGDSLSATSFLIAVEKEFNISLTGFIFYENATISGVAQAVEERQNNSHESVLRTPDFPPRIKRKLLRFLASWPGSPPFEGSYARAEKPSNSSLPFFFWCSNGVTERNLIAASTHDSLQLVDLRTLRKVQARRFRNYDLIAKVYAHDIERIQPEGPLILGGFCEGGRLIVNAARLLIAKGRHVQLLVLHDFLLEEPFPAHLAMVHSTGWKSYPPRLHHDINLGWTKIYRNQFGVLTKEGRHSGTSSSEFQEKLKSFLDDQLARSTSSVPRDTTRQDPHCSVKQVSPLPMFLKVNQKYPVTFEIKNNGPNTISANDGVVLHGRWIDINKRLKPGAPMFTELPSNLAPGDTLDVEIDLIAHKKNRCYQIQVAVIEEGWGWSQSCLQESHRQWRFNY